MEVPPSMVFLAAYLRVRHAAVMRM